MQRIGVRDLRRQLAAVLRRAEAGERVTVTVGGRPVAAIGPAAGAADDVTLAALVASGQLLPPRRSPRPPLADPLPVWAGVRLDQAFGEVRG